RAPDETAARSCRGCGWPDARDAEVHRGSEGRGCDAVSDPGCGGGRRQMPRRFCDRDAGAGASCGRGADEGEREVREQLTQEAIALLVAALVVFWSTVAILVRRHARHRR